ncbi:polyphosphate kinase [bacterium BMS3Bbin04]|nr:polyphosphate kinase [bacterium BMS3Bbin04]
MTRKKSETERDPILIDIGADPLPDGWEFADSQLDAPGMYLNREMTWLNFNRRVLHEAEESANPLLERLKYVAICSSNTDEFFMKRIGGLKQLIGAGVRSFSIDGRSPEEQLRWAYEEIMRLENDKSEIFENLRRLLKPRGIDILDYQDLTGEEAENLRNHFVENIFPLVFPQGVDPAHPFPFISNLSLNLLVTIKHLSHGESSLARVKVPVGLDVPRFIKIGDSLRFVKAEDVIAHNLDLLFPGVEIENIDLFRVTRNSNTEKNEEQADDLLELIEKEVRDRAFAPIVRLQVEADMDPLHLEMLLSALKLDESDVFMIDGMVGKNDLMELASLNLPDLKYPAHRPIEHPRLHGVKHIFHALRREGDILLVHPYESFTSSVERLLREAAEEPKVRAIRMTLYRTSSESRVVEYLKAAVANGKQVAVVIELKARFDEQANIAWANQLEKVGIHVTYGVLGFKTHTKLIQIVRKDYNGFRTYTHVSTGNYHADNALQYTDLGLMTCDREIGRDVTEIFNFLNTGYSPSRKYQKLLMAPSTLKRGLLSKIEREIEHQQKNHNGLIRMKLNALEDKDIVRALYQASHAGVKIELCVRDSCRLRPGVPGLSDSIQVRSIVGRFLEHSRVFHFHNGGEDELYIGSADAMRRNLEHRVEVLCPVDDGLLQKELIAILDHCFSNKYNHWEMQSDGTYCRPMHYKGHSLENGQEFLMKIAGRRERESEKLKKITSKGKSRRETWAGHIR